MNTTLPPENAELASKEDIQRLKILSKQSSLFKGPIPPPKYLEHYEKVLSGSADRILKMAEMQNESDIQLAKQEMSERKREQWLAFTIIMAPVVGDIIHYLFR